MRSLLLVLLALIPASAIADDLIYARDDRTELKLSDKDGGGYDFELRAYGHYDTGEYSVSYGELKAEGGALKAVLEQEGKPSSKLVVNGKVGAAKLAVEASGFAFENGRVISANGDYRKVTEAENLAMGRRRGAAADAALNEVYTEVKAEVGEAGFKALRDQQRAWLEHRTQLSEFQTREDKPEDSVNYWNTFTDLTSERCDFLHAYSGREVPAGRGGVYRDSFGGHLEIEETKAGLVFSISVVRGPSSHVGELAGVAQRKGERAVFHDKPDAGDDREPTEITLNFQEGHLVQLDGKNTSYYHGARAYFDGLYFKYGPLKGHIKLEP